MDNEIIIGYDGTEDANPIMYESKEKYKGIHQEFNKKMLLKRPVYFQGVIKALEKHIADKMPVHAAARSEIVDPADVFIAVYLYNPLHKSF